MQRSAPRALALALVLLSIPVFSGCTMKQLPIKLVGFGSGNVDGIWLWRLSAGTYARACRVNFSNSYFRQGVEYVSYDEYCLSGDYTKATLEAEVVRSSSDPTSATLQLTLQLPEAASTYRASAFNSAGESPLSSSSTLL